MSSVALAASVMMCLGSNHPPSHPASIAAVVDTRPACIVGHAERIV